MVSKIKSLVSRKTTRSGSYFDYSPKEKRKIIETAAKNAAKMKRDTIERYNLAFSAK